MHHNIHFKNEFLYILDIIPVNTYNNHTSVSIFAMEGWMATSNAMAWRRELQDIALQLKPICQKYWTFSGLIYIHTHTRLDMSIPAQRVNIERTINNIANIYRASDRAF
jgi:hypothetical protein